MHGGPSPGAPKGNKNAFKHGLMGRKKDGPTSLSHFDKWDKWDKSSRS